MSNPDPNDFRRLYFQGMENFKNLKNFTTLQMDVPFLQHNDTRGNLAARPMPSCYLESPASHLVVQNCDDRYISDIWILQMTYRSFFEVQPVFVGLHARLPQRMLQVVVKDWVQRLRLLDEAAEQSEVVHLELGARQWVAWLCLIIIKTMVLV